MNARRLLFSLLTVMALVFMASPVFAQGRFNSRTGIKKSRPTAAPANASSAMAKNNALNEAKQDRDKALANMRILLGQMRTTAKKYNKVDFNRTGEGGKRDIHSRAKTCAVTFARNTGRDYTIHMSKVKSVRPDNTQTVRRVRFQCTPHGCLTKWRVSPANRRSEPPHLMKLAATSDSVKFMTQVVAFKQRCNEYKAAQQKVENLSK